MSAQRRFFGGDHLDALADHMVNAIGVVGAEHVALGLDMEEFTATVLPAELRDVRDLPKLTELLIQRGANEEDIGAVYGATALRFLGRVLPSGDPISDRHNTSAALATYQLPPWGASVE